MASDVIAKLKVEGENSFSNSFKNATTSVKALDSAVKLSSAAFENNEDKMGALQNKSEALRKEIEAQERVVKLAAQAVDALTKEEGEGSTETQKYQKTLNDANTKLEKMKTQLNENEKAIKDFSTGTQEAGEKISAFGDKVSALGSKLAWVSAGATAALTGMFTAASDLNENLNKTEVVFDDLSGSIEEWSKTTLQSYGIAQSSSLEMISLFGDMATSMGLTTEQAAEMGKELVGRAGDLASFKNISLETAQTGLSAIFTGQAQSLKQFGIVMTEANLEAYALAEGFTKQYKEMDQAEKVMLRYQYVMDMTKNSAGDFANTSDGAANSVRVAQESLKEAAATLGQEVIPLVLPLIQDVTTLIQGINAMDEGTKKLIVDGLAIAAVASPVLTIGSKLIHGIGWMAKIGLPALSSAFGASGTAATAATTSMSVGLGAVLPVLAGLLAGIMACVYAYDKLTEAENKALVRRNQELRGNSTAISAEDAGFYRASDLVAIGYGDSTQYYLRNGAQMTSTGKAEWLDRQRELDSVTNNYNMDINVAQISDLQDLLNIADSAQLLERMG